MSFLDYLKDNRGQFIDHRDSSPMKPSPSAHEAELAATETPPTKARRRRSQAHRHGIRFRQVKPAFAPSPYTDPIPYEEPWERAAR